MHEIEGWLKKRTSGLIRRWQSRFFVLKKSELCYYYKRGDSSPAFTLNFNQISVSMHTSGSEIKLSPVGFRKTLRLKAINPPDLQNWVRALNYQLQISVGFLSERPGVRSHWKYPLIFHSQFLKQAQTGDILLFRSPDLLSKVLRGLTSSNFDHIALVIKDREDDIWILEATGNFGVKIIKWEEFLAKNWHTLYSKIAYRRLEYPRDDQFFFKVERFAIKSQGKKFKIDSTKLLCRKKTNKKTDNAYFCSELIARTYQEIGILTHDLPPWKYLPGDFERDVNLISGRLSSLKIIVFDK